MAARTASVKGGDKTEKYLAKLGQKFAAGQVKVGFLEGATYPARDRSATKLLKGLDTLNSTGPFQPGKKPSRAKDYRKALKTRVGPPKPPVTLRVAQVAFWNEYGTTSSPARPFMRNTVAERQSKWGEALASLAKSGNFTTKIALSLMGEMMKDDFVKAIVDWPADNAPLTIALKGFNKGLVEKGVMQRSVDYLVEIGQLK